ncbi:SDR family oxidoreductase [bacterium]|jgi:UDP-glucose 4-epimerase|nr:SDR family oxidoreductase [bacterium]
MSLPSILVVGANSFLARSFVKALDPRHLVRAISHDEVASAPLREVDCVINFAFHPALMKEPYQLEYDIDRRLLDALGGTDVHYVMLGSRKVYGIGCGQTFHEDDDLDPAGNYGQNKALIESHVRESRPGRHTIVRISNVIGHGIGTHTFIGQALQTLCQEGRISLNIDGSTRRDFLPLKELSNSLVSLALKRPPGTFNLGAGFSTPVGDIAQWLIDGYGSGSIEITDHSERDAFVLDISRVNRIVRTITQPDSIRDVCKTLGRCMKNG